LVYVVVNPELVLVAMPIPLTTKDPPFSEKLIFELHLVDYPEE
jgi:hypothetical protein